MNPSARIRRRQGQRQRQRQRCVLVLIALVSVWSESCVASSSSSNNNNNNPNNNPNNNNDWASSAPPPPSSSASSHQEYFSGYEESRQSPNQQHQPPQPPQRPPPPGGVPPPPDASGAEYQPSTSASTTAPDSWYPTTNNDAYLNGNNNNDDDDYYNAASYSSDTSAAWKDNSAAVADNESPAKLQAPKVPIHYDFPTTTNPITTDGDNEDNTSGRPSIGTASARNDLITRYMSTTSGKLQVHTSATVLGAGMGVFFSKTLRVPFATPLWLATAGAAGMGGSSAIFRTPWGELVRAVALSFLLVLQRTKYVRTQYPTGRYIAASFGLRPRRRSLRPFPPARNPWRYAPTRPDDPEFHMWYSLIAMALVGSTCGGTLDLPFLPTWLGSLLGAVTLAFMCTWTSSPRGDLARTVGMRVIATLQELWDLQAQLQIIPKAAIVSGQVIDRVMILDRQHKVKDRFLALINSGYDRAMQTASNVQQQRMDAQGRGGENTRTDGNSKKNDKYDDDDDDDSKRRGERHRRRRVRDGPNEEDRERYGSSPPSRRDKDRRPEDRDTGDWNNNNRRDWNTDNVSRTARRESRDAGNDRGGEDRRGPPREQDDQDRNDGFDRRQRLGEGADADADDIKPKKGWFRR